MLHIGTPKTGTSSIQDCLMQAALQGALGPYRYPLERLGDRNQNRLLSTLYLSHDDLPPFIRVQFPENNDRFRRTQRRNRRLLFRTLQSARGVIISAEVLGACFGLTDAIRLRSDFESLGFREFHVVLYVRDSADLYLSRTQEQLKSPVRIDLQAIIDPVSFRYAFRSIAETWEKAFPGRVIVRGYPSGPGTDVVEDFSQLLQSRLGITLPRSSTRLNTTLSAEAMTVIQNYRQAVDDNGGPLPGLSTLLEFLRKSRKVVPQQTRPSLKVAIAEQIRAKHREDAEVIHSRYGVDLGMGISGASEPIAASAPWRIEDILESVDPEIVQRLSDEFRRIEPQMRRPLPIRAATRAYRAVPYSRGLARLDAKLRPRFAQEPKV